MNRSSLRSRITRSLILRLATIADHSEKQYKKRNPTTRGAASHAAHADLLSDLGYSYLLQDRDKEAEKMLREALRSNPQHQYAARPISAACMRSMVGWMTPRCFMSGPVVDPVRRIPLPSGR